MRYTFAPGEANGARSEANEALDRADLVIMMLNIHVYSIVSRMSTVYEGCRSQGSTFAAHIQHHLWM